MKLIWSAAFLVFCLKPGSRYWSATKGAPASLVGLALCLCHDNKAKTNFLPWQFQFCSFSWKHEHFCDDFVLPHMLTELESFHLDLSCVEEPHTRWCSRAERKHGDACPALSHPAAGQGSLLRSQPAATLAPQPCLLCSHHQERLFSGGSFWPPQQGKQSKLSCPFLAFFCEPSVTSKPISRFFFGFTI